MTGPEQLGEHQGLPLLRCADAESWAAWLAANHATSPGVWLAIARAGSGAASVSYEQALDLALCQGWIDGRKQGGDAVAWRQKFTPRGPRSAWSQRNCEKAEALIAAGRMAPAGLAAVEAARRDGRWQAAYGLSRHRGVPDDLQAALDDNPVAAAFFATLDSRNRYAVLYRVQTARKPETRARRIADFVAMLARGERIHPSRAGRAGPAA
ncbi:YdeI/OmpD-associated family protein [Inquilinus limosus]|uniref:Bacteriocin-protection protein n=1 Tax=Inquilinus limosus TaxID=171674 RepID=A0A211ZNX7_9PROT|nr:YdeI/OmpD-associated family protein [Inquilinus limosus]OWJ66949.1 bacteriocin-protection protein [Inquilinus limosus]